MDKFSEILIECLGSENLDTNSFQKICNTIYDDSFEKYDTDWAGQAQVAYIGNVEDKYRNIIKFAVTKLIDTVLDSPVVVYPCKNGVCAQFNVDILKVEKRWDFLGDFIEEALIKAVSAKLKYYEEYSESRVTVDLRDYDIDADKAHLALFIYFDNTDKVNIKNTFNEISKFINNNNFYEKCKKFCENCKNNNSFILPSFYNDNWSNWFRGWRYDPGPYCTTCSDKTYALNYN